MPNLLVIAVPKEHEQFARNKALTWPANGPVEFATRAYKGWYIAMVEAKRLGGGKGIYVEEYLLEGVPAVVIRVKDSMSLVKHGDGSETLETKEYTSTFWYYYDRDGAEVLSESGFGESDEQINMTAQVEKTLQNDEMRRSGLSKFIEPYSMALAMIQHTPEFEKQYEYGNIHKIKRLLAGG